MWKDYAPHPFLHHFLLSKGVVVDPSSSGPITQFLELERSKKTNVEEFFEYCRNVRDRFTDHPSAWHDMLHFGFLLPITTAMITQFFENGVGWRRLEASSLVSSALQPGDLIVNLNYDTIFEMAVEAQGNAISYLPNVDADHIIVAKPHGSVNLLVNEKKQKFYFGRPQVHGTAVPTIDDSLAASILPPRIHKHYAQHPIARTILDATRAFAPKELIFWGVGFTQSDLDLNTLYFRLALSSDIISVINPDRHAAIEASEITRRATLHFPSLDSWLKSRGLLTSK